MIKRFINRVQIKPFALMILSIFTILTLASCGNGSRSFSSLKSSDIYATSGNYSITNGELWEELKWSANDILEEKITSFVLKAYVDEIKEEISKTGDTLLKERYLDELEKEALAEVYAITDVEDLKLYDAKYRKTLEDKFIDSYYMEKGVKLTNAELINEAGDTTLITGKTYYMTRLHSNYYEVVAEKLLAYHLLKDEIDDYNDDADSEDEYYYTPSDIKDYYNTHYKYDIESKLIMIRFFNQDEINTTFKAFGIKVYKDSYYFIPQLGKTTREYSTYYDEFDISLASNSYKCFNLSAIVGEMGIFELYIEISNYIYTYRDALPNAIGATSTTSSRRNITEAILVKYLENGNTTTPVEFIANWDDQFIESITYTAEDLNDIDLGLSVYVGSRLPLEEKDGYKRYTQNGYALGDYYYLMYKIDETKIAEDMVLYGNEDDEDEITNEDLKNRIIDELIWSEITQTKSTDYLNTEVGKVKVYIFDEALEICFAQKNSSYSKTHKKAPSKETLFTIKYKKNSESYKLEEIFNILEVRSGTATAIDLLSRKAIKDSEEYKSIKSSEIDTYKRNLEAVLNLFANNQLSSQGYPSTLGKYNFLMLYFHSADVDTIIDNFYKLNYASKKILTNYAKNDAIFEIMQQYAAAAYENEFNISAQNLLVYVDMDEDGVPDKDFDWTKTIYNSTVTYEEKALELVNYFITRMKNSKSSQAALLETMVEEYNSCQRFTNGIDTYEDGVTEYDPTEPETIWAEYRRAGLYISVTEYSDTTNKTEENFGETAIPYDLKLRLREIYKNDSDFRFEDSFPYEYIDSSAYLDGSKSGFLTKDGYNLLVITSATAQSSAEFLESDDINGIYLNISLKYEDEMFNIANIYNDDQIISLNQVKLFVYEYLKSSSTNLFPSSITTALTTYLLPVYEKYNDSATQRELLLNNLLGQIDFTDQKNADRLVEMMAINRRISDDYLTDTDMGNNFVNWWSNILTGGRD